MIQVATDAGRTHLARVTTVLAVLIAALGLFAIWQYGWTEIYADQWRLYRFYLEKPFPDSVLTLENGHRPVFPGLLRLAEMIWFSGNQRLQLATGALLALSTLLLLSWPLFHDSELTPARAAVALLIAAIGLFWLGNVRYLVHGNESVHGYLLTACLAAALVLATSRQTDLKSMTVAGVLASVATFSFGPGLAVFPALLMVLMVQRRHRLLLPVLTLFALTLLAYFLLPGNSGVRNSLGFNPVETLFVMSVWLCAAPVHLFLAFLDADIGQSLPGLLKKLAVPASRAYEAHFGDIWTQYRHVAIVGAAAILYVAWASFRAWRQQDHNRLLLMGLGIAWFTIAAAGIVALARADYFQGHPGQIFSNRFVPWSCLFWTGVMWIGRANTRQEPAHWRRRLLATSIGIVTIMALATTKGHLWWAGHLQQRIQLDAVGITVGVLPEQDGRYGEAFLPEIITGIPPVKAAGLSMFAWPETRWLNQPVPPALPVDPIPGLILSAEVIDNALAEGTALRLEAVSPQPPTRLPKRLLAVDDNGLAAGMLTRIDYEKSTIYRGYALSASTTRITRLIGLTTNDQLTCRLGC